MKRNLCTILMLIAAAFASLFCFFAVGCGGGENVDSTGQISDDTADNDSTDVDVNQSDSDMQGDCTSSDEQPAIPSSPTNPDNSDSEETPGEHIHNLEYYAAVVATCLNSGNAEYWQCSICNKYFSDAEAAQETTIDDLTTTGNHDVSHAGRVEPNCENSGNIEYWYCNVCSTRFADQECLSVLENESVVLKPHPNVSHTERVEPNCDNTGNLEYWECDDCGKIFLDESLTNSATNNDLVLECHPDKKFTAQKLSTCEEFGNTDYWYCEDCGGYFSDEHCTVEITEAEIIIPKHVGAEFVSAVAATCVQNGSSEYYFCYDCGRYFNSSDLLTEITLSETITAKLPHNLIHTAAVSPLCETGGNIEYWYCGACKLYYDDEECSHAVALSETALPAAGHEWDEWIVTKSPTCIVLGEKMRHCSACNKSEVGTVEMIAHNPNMHELAADPQCTKTGNYEFWYCPGCGIYYKDKKCAEAYDGESWRINMLGHNITVSVQSEEATCLKAGNEAYVYCDRCKQYYSDENDTDSIEENSWVIEILSHNITEKKMDEQPATCEVAGNYAYWYCSKCKIYYSDSECKNAYTKSENIWGWYISALGHSYVESYVNDDLNYHHTVSICSTCNEAEPNFKSVYSLHTFGENNAKGNVCEVCNNEIKYTTGLAYELNSDENGYIVTGVGTIDSTNLIIPPTYDRLPVTAIGDYAFMGFNVYSVTLSANITSIGIYAFYYCEAITSVILNNGLKTIGNYAFSTCQALTSITIPDSVTSIGEGAFNSCEKLSSVKLGSGITTIEANTFLSCSKLTSIVIPTNVITIADNAFASNITTLIYKKDSETSETK